MDSLETMEVIIECEGKTGKKIPNRRIHDIYTVKNLVDLFENQ
jgi:acyl carrier protein